MQNEEIILRLCLSMLLGGLIGIERQVHAKPAGLRTHILVCLSSTLMMLTSYYIFYNLKETVVLDPGRIAGQVISGIGFLGAGTIIVSRGSVKGLTTAATLWATAGVGLAVGCGFYLGALVTSLIILFSLIILELIEKKYLDRAIDETD